jgi:uncharacterized protein YndB with AHSA1/START domain
MNFEFESYLGAVARKVTALERDGKPAHKVTLERNYATTVDDLWDAITNPERLPRWFLPISGDLQQGGRYQLEGNAGGTITECEPPNFLSATWEFGGGVSWIELCVEPVGEDRARLSLSHICPLDDHWRQFGPGAVGTGWDLALIGLALHFARGATETLIFDEAAFAASPDGKAFISGSSEDWGRAAVVAGEDREQALGAASRTRAFYTGEDPSTS